MPRFYLTLALAWIWGWQAASAGDNENVEIGVSALSEPCGQSGGDRVEFLVAARQTP